MTKKWPTSVAKVCCHVGVKFGREKVFGRETLDEFWSTKLWGREGREGRDGRAKRFETISVTYTTLTHALQTQVLEYLEKEREREKERKNGFHINLFLGDVVRSFVSSSPMSQFNCACLENYRSKLSERANNSKEKFEGQISKTTIWWNK